MSATTYEYRAIDQDGAPHNGRLTAASEQEAYRRLAAQGLTPTTIRVESRSTRPVAVGSITAQDVAALTRELSVLLETNIPLARGLVSIAEHEEKKALRAVIMDVAGMIEAGSPLSVSLERYRSVFSNVYIETMRAAEKSGNISEIAIHLADMLERQIENRQQLRRALAYPIIVMSIVSLAITVIVVFVIPRFGATFAAQGIEMPMITKVLRAIGESVQSTWWLYLSFIVASIFGFVAAWRTPRGRLRYEQVFSRTPYIRRIISASTAAQFCRVFGLGIGSGLDLIESLEMSGRATGRPIFIAECEGMADRLRRGATLGDVLKNTKSLPSFARRMISAGRDSQELSKSCVIVARHYDREASHLTKNINTMIEPILTVAMAVIVLVIALSVFLPMWQMVGMNR